MTPAPRIRATEPATCDCPRRSCVHGSAQMYQKHSCGCTPCGDAYAEYRAGRRAFSEADPEPIQGHYVATFPVHGGISEARAERQAYDQLITLTTAAGVEVKGKWTFQFQPTPAGRFLTARAPAQTIRPRADVIADAELFAYEHERAHPRLAAWVQKHLEEVAA